MSQTLIAERYRLDAMIGKGSVGEVWQAQDILLQRTVAVKVVDLDTNTDETVPERFRREGIAIAGLDHPNIVKVYDTGTSNNKAYLVMDLLSGPNLATLVRESGPLDYGVGLRILAAVADALQSAHDMGITHRDIKPANIVMNAHRDVDGTVPDLYAHPERGRPIIVDFGIARVMNENEAQLTGTATAIGTAAYMSPEQAMNKKVESASDVYSLGCVAYFLFCGRPPFLGDSSVAVAHAQVYDEPLPLIDLRPDAPPALDALMPRMLDKRAGQRPSAAEVSEEMRRIAEDPNVAPVYKRTPKTHGEPSRLAKLTPKVLLIALIACLLGFLAYAWVRPGEVSVPGPTVTLTQTHTQTAQAPEPVEEEPAQQEYVPVQPQQQWPAQPAQQPAYTEEPQQNGGENQQNPAPANTNQAQQPGSEETGGAEENQS